MNYIAKITDAASIRDVQAQGTQCKSELMSSLEALRMRLADVRAGLVDTSRDHAGSHVSANNPPMTSPTNVVADPVSGGLTTNAVIHRDQPPVDSSSPGMVRPYHANPNERSAGSGADSRGFRPRVKLDALKIPKFDGSYMHFPEWRTQFTAIMEGQDLQDQVLLIYLRDALPKEYVYMLTGVKDMSDAWSRLEDRFGDANQRVLAIFSKLSALELKGKEYERLERLHFEVEHAISLMDSTGSSHGFSQDLYIVSTLLRKLAPQSVEKWDLYAETQPVKVVSGVNEWSVFRAWLKMCYQLAKRARLSAGLPNRPGSSMVPVKPAPAKPMCNKCRKIGHKTSDCPEEADRQAAYALQEFSDDDCEDRAVAFATEIEKASRYKDAEKRFGRCKLCNLPHTYMRKIGNERVEWPSERLSSCPTYMALNIKQRADLLEARKFCPRCLSWNHDKDGKCKLVGHPCKVKQSDGTECKRDHDKSLHDSKNEYCDASAVSVEVNAAEAQDA